MQITHDSISIKTVEPLWFIDITDKVEAIAKKAGIKNGVIVLTTRHTTTALCVNERCERLQEDMKGLLNRLVPKGAGYKHDHSTVDGRANAHNHLMSLLLRTTETIPVAGGRPQIGTWQSIFFIELDGPRDERNINVMVIGE